MMIENLWVGNVPYNWDAVMVQDFFKLKLFGEIEFEDIIFLAAMEKGGKERFKGCGRLVIYPVDEGATINVDKVLALSGFPVSESLKIRVKMWKDGGLNNVNIN